MLTNEINTDIYSCPVLDVFKYIATFLRLLTKVHASITGTFCRDLQIADIISLKSTNRLKYGNVLYIN